MLMLDRTALVALSEVGAWLLRRRMRVRVVGESMTPTLTAGEYVLVDRDAVIEPDAVVVAHHPQRRELLVVKRVGTIGPDGRVTLLSDNPDEGSDSRTWGPVPADSVVGRVTFVFGRPDAFGPPNDGPGRHPLAR